MSRIGKLPVNVPNGVTITLDQSSVKVKGPRGELSHKLPAGITVEKNDNVLNVARASEETNHKSLHGLTRSLIANMVTGVTEGFQKRLEIQGVGYRAILKGRDIELQVGYSHPVPMPAPEGIEFEVPTPTVVIIKGNSKQAVGEIAARIRKVRPPEPYKGKGIRYQDEYVARKVGKRA
jgi:large subunit ribosomal protein L6